MTVSNSISYRYIEHFGIIYPTFRTPWCHNRFMANATLRYRIFEYLGGQFLYKIWEISDSDSEALLQAVRQSQIPKRPIFVV